MVGLLVPADPCPAPLAAAFAQAAQTLAGSAPQTVVAISAAWRTRAFTVGGGLPLLSDATPSALASDAELALRIVEEALDAGLPATLEPSGPDSTALPVLLRLMPESARLVVLGVPLASPALLQEFGQAATRAARELGRRVLTVAVGGLTRHHNAAPDDGSVQAFTDLVLAHLARGEGDRLFEIDGALWVAARPEADLGHLAVLLGATGPDAEGETLAVEQEGGSRSAVVQLYAPAGPFWLPDPPFGDSPRAGGG